MLAVVAGLGWRVLLPFLARAPAAAAVIAGAYVGSSVTTLAALHPLEYVAMNAIAGGTRGAYDRFELDYWSAAATEALRRLEQRLDRDPSIRSAESPPRILICIGAREERVQPLLKRPWIVETDADKADFIIATQRSRCAENKPVVLIDEVKRFDRTFAWIYARKEGLAEHRSTAHSRTGSRIFPSLIGVGASASASLRASAVINSIWVRSFRCRLSTTIKLKHTQT
jgi:hypothetical protein